MTNLTTFQAISRIANFIRITILHYVIYAYHENVVSTLRFPHAHAWNEKFSMQPEIRDFRKSILKFSMYYSYKFPLHDWVISLKPFNALLFFAPLVTRSFTLRVSRDIRELWVAFPDTNNSSIPCRSVLDYPRRAASGQSAETRMDASTLIDQLPQPVTVVQCC